MTDIFSMPSGWAIAIFIGCLAYLFFEAARSHLENDVRLFIAECVTTYEDRPIFGPAYLYRLLAFASFVLAANANTSILLPLIFIVALGLLDGRYWHLPSYKYMIAMTAAAALWRFIFYLGENEWTLDFRFFDMWLGPMTLALFKTSMAWIRIKDKPTMSPGDLYAIPLTSLIVSNVEQILIYVIAWLCATFGLGLLNLRQKDGAKPRSVLLFVGVPDITARAIASIILVFLVTLTK